MARIHAAMIVAVVNVNYVLSIEFMKYFVARFQLYVYGSSLAPRPVDLGCYP